MPAIPAISQLTAIALPIGDEYGHAIYGQALYGNDSLPSNSGNSSIPALSAATAIAHPTISPLT